MRKSKHILSRPGVQFTDKQKEVIKSLVEIRKENEILEVVLVELDNELNKHLAFPLRSCI